MAIHRDASRLDRWWSRAEQYMLGACMIVMSLLVMGNVVSRNVFNSSWAFTEELGSLLVLVLTFGGLSYASRHRRHISMSVLPDLLPPRQQAVMQALIALVSAAVLSLMAYIGLRYVMQIAASGDTSNVLGIPLYIPLSIIPIGFLAAALQFAILPFTATSEDTAASSPHERHVDDAAGPAQAEET